MTFLLCSMKSANLCCMHAPMDHYGSKVTSNLELFRTQPKAGMLEVLTLSTANRWVMMDNAALRLDSQQWCLNPLDLEQFRPTRGPSPSGPLYHCRSGPIQ
ncbi:hypothetical protein Y032_0031g2377 [Ancylostoma ceylanicum]|uniref:Uncharacterized protein n=1 Tax=Ancylostoma ceylanicum TaxID=53326 RepID=A0A016UQ13_9BILA|nr:hypothetical protein Y032_0031g2377 [Ancylostoma ceylanicum]